ncbi:hypothetical protein G9X48_16090 [Cronobacter sp. HA18006]|nr:hypothetical protein [Cronobacter sp. HA18006]
MKTADAAKGQWAMIFEHYGLPPITGKNHFKGKCPVCDSIGKFRIDDRDGAGTWICTCGSGDGLKLVTTTQGKPFNQPALAAFTSEINSISATIVGQLDTNFKIGRRAALREIEDVKHDTREAEDVLDVAVAIAEADGEVEPEERKVLEEIANALGLRLENHL